MGSVNLTPPKRMGHPALIGMTIKEKLINELKTGKHFGIFIDDTGSPGMSTGPSLNPNRKSWIAVIIPPKYMPEVMDQMPPAISELRTLTGATEFHFSKIYSGSKQFENVHEEVRNGLIYFMGDIFEAYDLRVINQTLDPGHVQKWQKHLERVNLRPHFKLENHEHLSLLLLLFKLKTFMIENTDDPGIQAVVFVDEGIKKSGTCMKVPLLGDRFLS